MDFRQIKRTRRIMHFSLQATNIWKSLSHVDDPDCGNVSVECLFTQADRRIHDAHADAAALGRDINHGLDPLEEILSD